MMGRVRLPTNTRRSEAQFDVPENIGEQKGAIRWCQSQSSQFDNYRRRVVVPLVRAREIGPQTVLRTFNPLFTVWRMKASCLLLESFLLSPRSTGCSGRLAGDSAQGIIEALDELLTRRRGISYE